MRSAEERERLARILSSIAKRAVEREQRKAQDRMREAGGFMAPTLGAVFRGVAEMASVTAERETWMAAELRRYDETGFSPYLVVNVAVMA